MPSCDHKELTEVPCGQNCWIPDPFEKKYGAFFSAKWFQLRKNFHSHLKTFVRPHGSDDPNRSFRWCEKPLEPLTAIESVFSAPFSVAFSSEMIRECIYQMEEQNMLFLKSKSIKSVWKSQLETMNQPASSNSSINRLLAEVGVVYGIFNGWRDSPVFIDPSRLDPSS